MTYPQSNGNPYSRNPYSNPRVFPANVRGFVPDYEATDSDLFRARQASAVATQGHLYGAVEAPAGDVPHHLLALRQEEVPESLQRDMVSLSMLSSGPSQIGLYQGEDWLQQLTFYSDTNQTIPLNFSNPYLDIRDATTRYASFDSTGTLDGTATVGANGLLTLTLPYTVAAAIPANTYDLDIFATVAGKRKAILKVGALQLVVVGRVTQEL